GAARARASRTARTSPATAPAGPVPAGTGAAGKGTSLADPDLQERGTGRSHVEDDARHVGCELPDRARDDVLDRVGAAAAAFEQDVHRAVGVDLPQRDAGAV